MTKEPIHRKRAKEDHIIFEQNKRGSTWALCCSNDRMPSDHHPSPMNIKDIMNHDSFMIVKRQGKAKKPMRQHDVARNFGDRPKVKK
jgi:hypothetical protein